MTSRLGALYGRTPQLPSATLSYLGLSAFGRGMVWHDRRTSMPHVFIGGKSVWHSVHCDLGMFGMLVLKAWESS